MNPIVTRCRTKSKDGVLIYYRTFQQTDIFLCERCVFLCDLCVENHFNTKITKLFHKEKFRLMTLYRMQELLSRFVSDHVAQNPFGNRIGSQVIADAERVQHKSAFTLLISCKNQAGGVAQ